MFVASLNVANLSHQMNSSAFQNNTFSFPVRVYYEDTDAGGVVYHANYLKFYERARTEMLSAIGIEQDGLLAERVGFVVKRFTVDNLASAQFNDRLVVKSRITQLTKARIVFSQWIELDEQTINQAEVLVASVDLSKMKPLRIPEHIYEVIQSVC